MTTSTEEERKAAAKLTPRQVDVLGELESAVRINPGVRVTPYLLGGTDGSHHSSTLSALCKKELATRKKWGITGACGCRVGPDAMFGHRCKGSCTYEITTAGLEELNRLNPPSRGE